MVFGGLGNLNLNCFVVFVFRGGVCIVVSWGVMDDDVIEVGCIVTMASHVVDCWSGCACGGRIVKMAADECVAVTVCDGGGGMDVDVAVDVRVFCFET